MDFSSPLLSALLPFIVAIFIVLFAFLVERRRLKLSSSASQQDPKRSQKETPDTEEETISLAEFLKEIEPCTYLFLEMLFHSRSSGLQILIAEGKVNDTAEDVEICGQKITGSRAVEVTAKSKYFRISWASFVSYSIRQESYTPRDETEKWEGANLFRLYSQSKFRDHVSKSTFASDQFPGPLQHWSVLCEWDIIDVIGSIEPVFQRIRVKTH